MSIEISREIEARITHEARKRGISVDALLGQLMSERGSAPMDTLRIAPELPVWHLGDVGPLHRREIYGDVR